VVNMNMRGIDTSGEEKEAKITDYLADTIAAVFPEVATVDVANATNRELFAGETGMLERFRKNRNEEKDEDLALMMSKVDAGLTVYSAGDHVMTDDKAPVELLGMQVIDEIIRDEVAYYKRIYEEKGWEGLMDAL